MEERHRPWTSGEVGDDRASEERRKENEVRVKKEAHTYTHICLHIERSFSLALTYMCAKRGGRGQSEERAMDHVDGSY